MTVMTSIRSQIYRCEKCGIVTEILHGGTERLECCGEPLQLCIEGTDDSKVEKHVPVSEKDGDELVVRVGSVPHPMTEEHHIECIEVVEAMRVTRVYLTPGNEPVARFPLPGESVIIREYCNLHGLWRTTWQT
jgi:superoxide reductase